MPGAGRRSRRAPLPRPSPTMPPATTRAHEPRHGAAPSQPSATALARAMQQRLVTVRAMA